MYPVHTPAARNSDPSSSHYAADYMDASGKRAHQQHRAYAAVKAHPGKTSMELHTLTEICRFELARRLPECETGKLVRKGATRVCTISGRKAVTWWPAEPGEQLELVA